MGWRFKVWPRVRRMVEAVTEKQVSETFTYIVRSCARLHIGTRMPHSAPTQCSICIFPHSFTFGDSQPAIFQFAMHHLPPHVCHVRSFSVLIVEFAPLRFLPAGRASTMIHKRPNRAVCRMLEHNHDAVKNDTTRRTQTGARRLNGNQHDHPSRNAHFPG